MQNNANAITVSLGTRSDDATVSHDVKKLPHLLIAGGENEEAKKLLSAVVTQAVSEKSPDELRLLLLHFDKSFGALPHLLTPVIDGEKEAEAALSWLKGEADRRFELFSTAGVYNIDAFNEKEENGLYYVIAAIGELEKLTNGAKEIASMLAAKARAAGIYLLVAAEKAEPKIIIGLIKANIPSRIALKTETKAQSRVIIDAVGAEALKAGEMLFYPIGNTAPERLAYSLPTDAELIKKLAEIKEKYSPAKTVDTSEQRKEASLLVSALSVLLEYGSVSASLLQRALKITYAKAAALINEMEESGYIGEYRGSIPRKTLITEDELKNIINELTDKEI